MLERRNAARGDKVDDSERLLCCSALKFVRILSIVYSLTGSLRFTFFLVRGFSDKLYSFPTYHDEYWISGVEMIVISILLSIFMCCPSRTLFTVAFGLVVAAAVGGIVALILNFKLLTHFGEDDYKLHIIRAGFLMAQVLNGLLTWGLTKLSCICGCGRDV